MGYFKNLINAILGIENKKIVYVDKLTNRGKYKRKPLKKTVSIYQATIGISNDIGKHLTIGELVSIELSKDKTTIWIKRKFNSNISEIHRVGDRGNKNKNASINYYISCSKLIRNAGLYKGKYGYVRYKAKWDAKEEMIIATLIQKGR